MAAGFVVAGASLFLLLAIGHVVLMAQSTPTSGPMTPIDPVIQAALERPGGIGMAPELNSSLFRAWTGFNHSHSLGLALFAFVVIAQTISDLGAALDQAWFLAFIVAVPAMYLALSLRYWFEKPTSAFVLGSVLIWTGVAVGVT